MTTEEIKGRMKEKGLSERDLAKRCEASQTAIHFFIHRKIKSANLEKRVARALGVKLHKLRGEQTVGQ